MGRNTDHRNSTSTGLLGRVVGVAGRRETYENLAYLLARFPLGVAYFTTFVTGLSVGLALLPLLVGVPILAGVVAAAGYVGVVEAALLRRLRDRSVGYDLNGPGEQPLTTYLATAVTTPRNYLLLLFALGSFAVGIPLFAVVVTGVTLSATLLAAPVLYWLPGVDYRFTTAQGPVNVGPVTLDAAAVRVLEVSGFTDALAASLVGAVVSLVGLHAANLTARLVGAGTERLLRTA